MPLQNLEQVRAKSALTFSKSSVEKRGKDGGKAIMKIPAMIMGNGLLASVAFAIEADENGPARPGFAAIFDAIALHLSSKEIDILSAASDAGALIEQLASSDSQTLKLATAESLAWLSYARRFVGGAGDESQQEEHP